MIPGKLGWAEFPNSPQVSAEPTAPTPTLAITTTSMSDGRVGIAYKQTLAATGGLTPYNWAVASGSLAPGLLLSSGTISGTPTLAGEFSFSIRVTDGVGNTANQTYSANIERAGVPAIPPSRSGPPHRPR